MQIRCGSCDQLIETPPEWSGGPFNCPACNCLIELPEQPTPTTSPAESSASPTQSIAPEPTKACPYCGETILKIARKCKHCKEVLRVGLDFDPECARERLRIKAESLAGQLAIGSLPPIPWSVGGKIRPMTVVLAAAALAFLVGTVVGFSMPESSELFVLGPLGLFPTLIAGVLALISFARDMMTPSALGRTTPQRGAQAFLKSLCTKRYKYAYACLLDADKDGTVRVRPTVRKMEVTSGKYDFSTYRGFRDYWRGLLHHRGCQASVSSLKVVESSDQHAVVSATISLNRSSGVGFLLLGILGAMLMAKKDTLHISKLLRKVEDQWYVVNGEFASAEDRAMQVAAEVAGAVRR